MIIGVGAGGGGGVAPLLCLANVLSIFPGLQSLSTAHSRCLFVNGAAHPEIGVTRC